MRSQGNQNWKKLKYGISNVLRFCNSKRSSQENRKALWQAFACLIRIWRSEGVDKGTALLELYNYTEDEIFFLFQFPSDATKIVDDPELRQGKIVAKLTGILTDYLCRGFKVESIQNCCWDFTVMKQNFQRKTETRKIKTYGISLPPTITCRSQTCFRLKHTLLWYLHWFSY